jgi:hypothetical protein
LVEAIKYSLEAADVEGAVGGPRLPSEGKQNETPVPLETLRRRVFGLYPAQDENVTAALARAQQLSKSEKVGHNLDMICTDFLATNDFRGSDDPNNWRRFLAKYEQLLGKCIVVLDPATKTVWYGAEKLKKFVESMDD